MPCLSLRLRAWAGSDVDLADILQKARRKGGYPVKEGEYFQSALSDFAREVANGGAIRHLTDLGYTAGQIADRLDFPASPDRVKREMWNRLTETEVILTEEPGGRKQERYSYVREYDSFGHSSFRRVSSGRTEGHSVLWREIYGEAWTVDFARAVLQEKLEKNGEKYAYMSCDFGVSAYKDPPGFCRQMQLLDEAQREYVEGLPWEKKRVYHRMDRRMTGILERLYAAGEYHGVCCFIKTEEKIYLT